MAPRVPKRSGSDHNEDAWHHVSPNVQDPTRTGTYGTTCHQTFRLRWRGRAGLEGLGYQEVEEALAGAEALVLIDLEAGSQQSLGDLGQGPDPEAV
jgi:hypothetical protein